MGPETKTCQNCKQPFTVTPEDFAFYEKIKVPPPTFCFDCRVQRRMAFRNERVLYKRKCDAPGHNEQVISVFSADKKQRVYDHAAWWGDSWDPLSYGRDVDLSRPFFAQLKELWAEVPDISVLNINPVNSEYCSITEGNKNCYLVFGGDFNENTQGASPRVLRALRELEAARREERRQGPHDGDRRKQLGGHFGGREIYVRPIFKSHSQSEWGPLTPFALRKGPAPVTGTACR